LSHDSQRYVNLLYIAGVPDFFAYGPSFIEKSTTGYNELFFARSSFFKPKKRGQFEVFSYEMKHKTTSTFWYRGHSFAMPDL
jgi:hypothetical protein